MPAVGFPEDDDDFLGVTIAGRYRIVSQLGAAGIGTAYRAWDEQDGVPVVIKFLRKDRLHDPQTVGLFRRLQGLRHPHIRVNADVGEHAGLPYVVMRARAGESLSSRRLRDDSGKPRPSPAGMLHSWLPAIADVLDYVHSQGVVHRDVKPANIFFDPCGTVYLGDFGISTVVEMHLGEATPSIGDPRYMSPEQFSPIPAVDGRADQYALAVTTYEMLAGFQPFDGASFHLIVEAMTRQAPPLRAARRDLPRSLTEAVHRGLAKEPSDRFPTCRDFATAVLRDVPPMEDEPGVARLSCPKCANILKLPTDAAGQKGKCPKCQAPVKVAEDLRALWLLGEAEARGLTAPTGGASGPTTGGLESLENDVRPIGTLLDTTPPEKPRHRLPRARRRFGPIVFVTAVLGAVGAFLAIQLMLWWILANDPLGIAASLPTFLEWIAPPGFRQE